jgi:hypothetical protein
MNTIAVNFPTGNVVAQEKTQSYRIPQEPPYVKLYLDAIMYLCDLQERHANVLMAILRFAPFADFEHQFVIINRSIKLLIAKELGKSEHFVNHAIMELAQGKILLHNDVSPRSASYQINPHIIARGNWKDIEKLRLHVDFDARGKTFWTEIQIQKKLAADRKYREAKRGELAEAAEA